MGKKRILCLLLACAMCVGCLAGCGNSDNQDDTAETTQAAASTPEADAPFGLNKDDITLVSEGETWVLYDGNVDKTQVVWSSEDEGVATVTDGVVTAMGQGMTTVHADYMGNTYSCIVRCNLRFFRNGEGDAAASTDGQATGSYGVDERDPVQAPPTPVKSASFFDDAVFIGDSVTLKLSYYAASSGDLGNAQFLTRGSYSASHAVEDTMLLTYQGQEMKIEDAVAATGAGKVFLMLGMNDIAIYGIDGTIENWGKLIERIQTKCPNVKIYIQSMTPIWTGGEVGDLNNENMDAYNEALEAFAVSKGIDFIDVAPYMKDATGGLATRYCSDEFVHVTDQGSDAWIRVLKAYDYD